MNQNSSEYVSFCLNWTLQACQIVRDGGSGAGGVWAGPQGDRARDCYQDLILISILVGSYVTSEYAIDYIIRKLMISDKILQIPTRVRGV